MNSNLEINNNELDNIDSLMEPLLKYISAEHLLNTIHPTLSIYQRVEKWRQLERTKNIACCYKCHQSNKQLHLLQIPTLRRLADESIESHHFCDDCIKK